MRKIRKKKIKKKKQPKLSALLKKAEHLQREYFFKMYGKICEFCGDTATCLDHCFSRRKRQLFFEKANLSRCCQACNMKKKYAINGFDLDVYNHVAKREGQTKFDEMYDISKRTGETFPAWDRNYLTDKIEHFKKLLEAL